MKQMDLGRQTARSERVMATLMIAPVVLLLEALIDFPRAALSFHLLALLIFCLALGGPLLTAIQVLTGARWLRQLRPHTSQLMRLCPVAGALFFIALLLSTGYYPDGSHLPNGAFRDAWLSQSLILLRGALFISLWNLITYHLRHSVESTPQSAGAKYSRKTTRLAVAFLLVFGATWWLACVDWLMALSPGWYSSIFWMYWFGGTLLGGVALVALLTLLRPTRPVEPEASRRIHHDLGKMLFGLSCFWAYLWFSQFMLIWYANLPVETS
ncbi:MAG: hypothetical protein JSU96_11685, partial [Acidobacteriota bacterium]